MFTPLAYKVGVAAAGELRLPDFDEAREVRRLGWF